MTILQYFKENSVIDYTNVCISPPPLAGDVKMYRTCGIEGFKNTRKGTNIAAQATAISLATVSVHLAARIF